MWVMGGQRGTTSKCAAKMFDRRRQIPPTGRLRVAEKHVQGGERCGGPPRQAAPGGDDADRGRRRLLR